ncbi:MAG: hypothetical protein ACK4NS_03015 [Saprospiraceae bacterium]
MEKLFFQDAKKRRSLGTERKKFFLGKKRLHPGFFKFNFLLAIEAPRLLWACFLLIKTDFGPQTE